MSSLITDFEYDIFISYRHNDNRSGWVTEFVNALQEELASTIKEPLSIYFDKNRHDGLLETHNVNKSLEGKLKCLIFIPIISQTYCDPKSFAWQHEFAVFNKLAKEDPFGRDIKLSNGNVASRILPIKIHDLDVNDNAFLESELAGVLRAVDFIYREPGVNRPLKLDDTKTDNQNKTDYKNQVNKVANAVKEIITAIKTPVPTNGPAVASGQDSVLTNQRASTTKKILSISLVITLLVALAYFFYQQRISAQTNSQIEKSIAVLPFADLSPQGDQEYLGDGISEEIINVLAQSEELKVIARSSSFQFKGKNEDMRTIGKMLGVATILEGSVRKYKDQVRVTAQLINVKDGSHFWSKSYDKNTDNIFEIQDGIAAEVAGALKITFLEGRTTTTHKPWNEEAQRLYQQGRYFYDRMEDSAARPLLMRSVALDSNQAISYLYLSMNSTNLGDSSARQRYLNKSFELDPTLTESHAMKGLEYYRNLDFDNALKEMNIALSNGSNSPVTQRNAARVFQRLGRSAQATAFAKKAVELDPLQTRSWSYLIETYYYDRKYSDALQVIGQLNNSDVEIIQFYEILCLLHLNRYKDAESLIKAFGNPEFQYYLNLCLKSLRGEMTETLLKEVEKKYGHDPKYFYSYAIVLTICGKTDKAFVYLEKVVKRKKIAYLIFADPMLDPLREDARFKKLLEGVNYPK